MGRGVTLPRTPGCWFLFQELVELWDGGLIDGLMTGGGGVLAVAGVEGDGA